VNPDTVARLRDACARAAQTLGDTAPEGARRVAERLGVAGIVTPAAAPARDVPRLLGALHGQLLRETATTISAAFSAAGLPHVFVKGIVFVDDLYPPGARELADIDVYVARDAAPAARATLESLGFRVEADDPDRGPSPLRPGLTLVRAATSDVESAVVDLHWGVEPLTSLLPRDRTPLPRGVWDRARQGRLPAPCPGDHAALLVHHLVHHDFLHVVSLVDLAVLWPQVLADEGTTFAATARALRAGRVARIVADVLARDLGLARPPRLEAAPSDWRARRLAASLRLDRWLAWAAAAGPSTRAAITPGRVGRRLLAVEHVWNGAGVVWDALWPPQAHLRWRWPEARTRLGALARHWGSVGRKVAR